MLSIMLIQKWILKKVVSCVTGVLPTDICIVDHKESNGLDTLTAHNTLYASVEAKHSMNHYEMSEVEDGVLWIILKL